MSAKKLILLLLLNMFFLAGCAFSEPETPVLVSPTHTTVPFTPQPTATTQTPTETPRPIGPACRLDIVPADLVAETYTDYPAAILKYLNAGGSPVLLKDLLSVRGVAGQPVAVAVADFTGDGRDDVAVSLINPDADDLDGRLVIYACGLGSYEILMTERANMPYTSGFRLWFWQDLNGDKSVELVVSKGLCGAHTCFEDVWVLSYDGAGLINRLPDNTNELPFPTLQVDDSDGDGFYRLEIATGGFGSAGAGPQRPFTWIWDYNPGSGTWQFKEQRPDPSPYRIHILHDADDASARADYDQAVALYLRVINEPGLDDWITGEEGHAALAAYARFRIFAIAVALSDTSGADTSLAEMQALYPVNDPRHDFVEMAILFRNAYASGGLGSACAGAAGFAESHADVVLDPLGSQVYGYANRDYMGESMCPAPTLEGEE